MIQAVKNLPANTEYPWVGKILWRRKWQPIPVFVPGEFHGQRSLVGYSPWGPKESTQLSDFHFISLEGLIVFIEPFNFSFFSITGSGMDLDYCDVEWFALETN